MKKLGSIATRATRVGRARRVTLAAALQVHLYEDAFMRSACVWSCGRRDYRR
jgi:hypothetical protein